MSQTHEQPSLMPVDDLWEFEPIADDGSHGEVFTRRWMAKLILDLAGYRADLDLGSLQAVEPSCGSGAFLLPMVERLSQSLRAHGCELESAVDAIRATDLLPRNVEHCRKAATALLVADGWTTETSRMMTERWIQAGDYLLSDRFTKPADIVVGNPPYIRLEDIPTSRTLAYRSRFTTMGGRADIYIAFYEQGLKSLRPGGRLAFICADRWMRNHYGSRLRSLVTSSFSIDAVIEAHDVAAFEADVSAYPAVTLLSRRQQGVTVLATATREFAEQGAAEFFSWFSARDTPVAKGTGFNAAELPGWHEGESSWPTGTPEQLRVLEDLNERFGPLQDSATGTRVGIGVATGADKVFVTATAPDIEEDRLLPLAMSRDTVSGRLAWSGHYLVNPWGPDGRLVDIARYPRMEKYLDEWSTHVRSRHVAEKNPDKWFRTIDRVEPTLAMRPKLLFPDMKMMAHPVLDPGGLYPHHNLYFVTSDSWDLRVLGGLLLSCVAQFFVERYAVRMRGGTLRFQAQYLRRIRVPHPSAIGPELAHELAEAFDARDEARATKAALTVYGLEGLPTADKEDETHGEVQH